MQAIIDGSESEAYQFRIDDVKSPQSLSVNDFGNESKVDFAEGS